MFFRYENIPYYFFGYMRRNICSLLGTFKVMLNGCGQHIIIPVS